MTPESTGSKEIISGPAEPFEGLPVVIERTEADAQMILRAFYGESYGVTEIENMGSCGSCGSSGSCSDPRSMSRFDTDL